jgi:hypothetical protein
MSVVWPSGETDATFFVTKHPIKSISNSIIDFDLRNVENVLPPERKKETQKVAERINSHYLKSRQIETRSYGDKNEDDFQQYNWGLSLTLEMGLYSDQAELLMVLYAKNVRGRMTEKEFQTIVLLHTTFRHLSKQKKKSTWKDLMASWKINMKKSRLLPPTISKKAFLKILDVNFIDFDIDLDQISKDFMKLDYEGDYLQSLLLDDPILRGEIPPPRKKISYLPSSNSKNQTEVTDENPLSFSFINEKSSSTQERQRMLRLQKSFSHYDEVDSERLQESESARREAIDAANDELAMRVKEIKRERQIKRLQEMEKAQMEATAELFEATKSIPAIERSLTSLHIPVSLPNTARKYGYTPRSTMNTSRLPIERSASYSPTSVPRKQIIPKALSLPFESTRSPELNSTESPSPINIEPTDPAPPEPNDADGGDLTPRISEFGTEENYDFNFTAPEDPQKNDFVPELVSPIDLNSKGFEESPRRAETSLPSPMSHPDKEFFQPSSSLIDPPASFREVDPEPPLPSPKMTQTEVHSDAPRPSLLQEIASVPPSPQPSLSSPKMIRNDLDVPVSVPAYSITEEVSQPSNFPNLTDLFELPCVDLLFNVPKTGDVLRVLIRHDDEGDATGLFVHGFIPYSRAEEQGLLKVGDEIISVNGIHVGGKQLDDVVVALQNHHDEFVPIVIRRRDPLRSPPTPWRSPRLSLPLEEHSPRPFTTEDGSQPDDFPDLSDLFALPSKTLLIEVPKTNGQLRVMIRHDDDGVQKGLFVHGFRPYSNAEAQGLLQVGDEILEVDGVNLAGSQIEELIDVLKANQGDFVNLFVCRRDVFPGLSSREANYSPRVQSTNSPRFLFETSNPHSATPQSAIDFATGTQDRAVAVPRTDGLLRVIIKNTGNDFYVHGFKGKSRAEEVLKPGDVILAIDGNPLSGLTLKEVAALITSCDLDEVPMLIRRNYSFRSPKQD